MKKTTTDSNENKERQYLRRTDLEWEEYLRGVLERLLDRLW